MIYGIISYVNCSCVKKLKRLSKVCTRGKLWDRTVCMLLFINNYGILLERKLLITLSIYFHEKNPWNHLILLFYTWLLKKSRSRYPSELQPIALCNMTYKILGKLIENWLKPPLPSLIDISQGGFVAGRGTSDNTIVVFETIHFCLRREPKLQVLPIIWPSKFTRWKPMNVWAGNFWSLCFTSSNSWTNLFNWSHAVLPQLLSIFLAMGHHLINFVLKGILDKVTHSHPYFLFYT